MASPTRILMAIILASAAVPSFAGSLTDQLVYVGEYSGEEVFVVVEAIGGFGVQACRAALDCDGKFGVIGADTDKTVARTSVASAEAISFFEELLAIDFMGQPATFRAARGEISVSPDGRVVLTQASVVDGRIYRITLHIRDQVHTVEMEMPAWGAPEALHQWLNRFRDLVKQQASWVSF